MDVIHIDFLTVFVATIVYMIIGAVWYSPLLFGKKWVKLMRFTSPPKATAFHYIGALVIAFVIAFFLELVKAYLGASTTIDGMIVGGGIWLGFVLTTQLSNYIWSKKPFSLFLIDVGYFFVGFVVMGGILGS